MYRRLNRTALEQSTRWCVCICFGVVIALTDYAHAAYTLDRWYRMGDSPTEQSLTTVANGAEAGADIGGGVYVTGDSAPSSSNLEVRTAGIGDTLRPTYVEYDFNAGTANQPEPPVPAASSSNGFGIRFDGVEDYLIGDKLNNPINSVKAGTNGYTTRDRGYQLWVMPEDVDGAAEYIIDDADKHGHSIAASGEFLPEIRNNGTQPSGFFAENNQWYHLMLVRPNGDNSGVRSYVNGLAGTAQTGDYADEQPLVKLILGANNEISASETIDPPSDIPTIYPNEAAGFFTGIIDEVQMFVFDDSNPYSYTEDNGYFTDVFLPEQPGTFYDYVDDGNGHNASSWVQGDIDFDGDFDDDDIELFKDGWLSTSPDLPGIGPNYGDYSTLQFGDLDLDGDTDLGDWVVLRQYSQAAGLSVPSLSELSTAVPEPGTVLLAAMFVGGLFVLRRRW